MKFVLLAEILTLPPPNYCNRRTKAVYSRVGLKELSTDLQRVGREQIVSTRVMVRVEGLWRFQSIMSFVRRNDDRVPPRLKICSVDILYDARYSEVVDAPR